MPNLPIKRIVLYKHGVGFFERYGLVGETAQVELTFKQDEMNDVLKSLAAFPQGDAQVINVSYETPEDKQAALDKAPIVLGSDTALLDLLKSLRGRQICLHLQTLALTPDQPVPSVPPVRNLTGSLLGVDYAQAVDQAIVSVLVAGSAAGQIPEVRTCLLRQVGGVDVLEPQSSDDLRYVLELSRTNSETRSVTILMSQPQQPLLVSYITPTPTWRVSYRLVYTSSTPPAEEGTVFLQGWGIVNNDLDEDLNEVELTLIAGQPISFVYDLYDPHYVDRPRIADDDRTVIAPVMFEEALNETAFDRAPGAAAPLLPRIQRVLAAGSSAPVSKREWTTATQVQATGVAQGELFQYNVTAPITIKRGQSAMVPILGASLAGRKEHFYNREKVPGNPVVAIVTKNTTGLTLEHGPVTVLEANSYVGEAVIAFTPEASELIVPYAVDLGVKVTDAFTQREEIVAIRWQENYLMRDCYLILSLEYHIENRHADPINLVIEQRIKPEFSLFNTPDVSAQTGEFYRWRLVVPPRQSLSVTVNERQLFSRHEALTNLNYANLQSYLDGKFIDRALFDQLNDLLTLHQQVAERQVAIDDYTDRRNQILEEQEQVARKLQPLHQEGAEGDLRQRYVAKLQSMEDESDRLAQIIAELKQEILELTQRINGQMANLNQSTAE